MRVLSWGIMETPTLARCSIPFDHYLLFILRRRHRNLANPWPCITHVHRAGLSYFFNLTDPFTTPPGFLPTCRSATPSVPKVFKLMNLSSLILLGLTSTSLENIWQLEISHMGHSVDLQCKDCYQAVLWPNNEREYYLSF